jgi:osmotically-inducible protein OsmY
MNTTINRWFAAIYAGLICWTLGASAQQVADSEITRSLEHAFQRDLRLRDAGIQVSTFMGTATLKGTVDSLFDAQEAVQIAKRTVGVQSIVNDIQVDPLLRRDSEIGEDVRRRLTQSSFIQPTELEVQVAGGIVTLAGTVPTWAQCRQAERVAREVRGVKLVRNNLTVQETDASARRSDEAIRSDVEVELARDAHLTGLPISVFVEDGVVRLEGEVPNLFHRDRASEEVRRVANVRSVNNQLAVMSQLTFALFPEPPSDAELRRVVLEELKADPRVVMAEVEVAVNRRKVTLIGAVTSMFERQAAERIARSVTGVTRVENKLAVMAAGRSDEEIRADVRFNLASDSRLSTQELDVIVQNAAVTLSGEVTDHYSKFHAARLAARVQGVRSITNEVKVRWNAGTSDDGVRIRIEERLRSNSITRPIASRIRVAVRDGHVSLAGSVDYSSQFLEAARIARLTDGVRTVKNMLTIDLPK